MVKLSWVCGFVGGLHYIKYFHHLRSNSEMSVSWSGLVGYPLVFCCGSGVCSRLLWESIGLDWVKDEESTDRQYLILTARLMELCTGEILNILFGGLVDKYIKSRSKKLDVKK